MEGARIASLQDASDAASACIFESVILEKLQLLFSRSFWYINRSNFPVLFLVWHCAHPHFFFLRESLTSPLGCNLFNMPERTETPRFPPLMPANDNLDAAQYAVF